MSTTSPLFRRILVPMDDSTAGTVAVAVARRIAGREGSALHFLRVESRHMPLPEVLADTASLSQKASEAREGGVPAFYRVEYGDPAECIAEVAAKEDVSLLVLAHHHRGLISGMIHPSVTARTFSRTLMPILVWPDGLAAHAYDELLAPPNAVVLVPLDGSAEAEQALPTAVDFAKRQGCVLLLARVLVPLPLGMAGARSGDYLDSQRVQVESVEARSYLSTTRKRLVKETSLVVQSLLLEGSTASEIGKALLGHAGSLIVMTTHGRAGLGKLFFGSVASDMIDQAQCPVLVIPPVAVEQAGETIASVRGVSVPALG